jgi:sulfur-oxidizing protein SoxY
MKSMKWSNSFGIYNDKLSWQTLFGMNMNRRRFIKHGITLCTAGFVTLQSPTVPAEWLAADFAPGSAEATFKQLLKGKPVTASDKLELTIPEIAENGALVPVTVSTSLDHVISLAVVVEKNPVPLALHAEFSPELLPFLSARLKMASTCFVYALAETDKEWLSVKKLVKVTIGGCGG